MSIELEVELLDNGITIKTDNGYSEAVLYGNEGVDEFSECCKSFGEIVLEQFLIGGDEAARERYEKDGKTTYGYRFEVKVTPLAKGEFKY